VHTIRTPVSGHLGDTAQLTRGQDCARNAQAEHERILRRSDVKEAVELEAEEVVGGRRFVFACICDELVPDVDRVLFALPAFLFAEIGDGRTEVHLFLRGGLIGETGCGIVGDVPRGSMADERDGAALCYSCEKALQVLLLLCGEGCRIDFGSISELNFHARGSLYEVPTRRRVERVVGTIVMR